MDPDESLPNPAPTPEPPATPRLRPAGLKQLFTAACLLLINPFVLFYEGRMSPFLILSGIVSLLAFLFSVAGLWKARRLRFRIYGVLLSLETALPVAILAGHYWHRW